MMTAAAAAADAADEARVELGSKLLDKISPGWDRKIDLGSLDIAHPYCCILCQVYGSFQAGLEQLECEEQFHHTLNTLVPPPVDRRGSPVLGLGFAVESFAQNATLTAAWTRFILARRAAQAPTA